MTLSREEALLRYIDVRGHSTVCPVSRFTGEQKCECWFTPLRDALLLALTPPAVAPVAAAAAAGLAVPPPAPTPAPEAKRDGYDALTDAEGRDIVEAIDRTRAERVAFDKDDAPEAKRPTHVRTTREIPSWSGGDRIEAGTVLPVARWEGGDRYPYIDSAHGGFILHTREWEPCDAPAPCPPPVAGSVDDARWRPSVEGCGKCLTSTWCCAARACLSESTPDGDHDVATRLALALSRTVRP